MCYIIFINRLKGRRVMKSKLLNLCITLLAVIGVIICVGAVGTMDYMTELGRDYPLINTIKTTLLGIAFICPAVIREVMI